MRLNESTLHSWDVRVGLDPDAAVPADAAQLLLEHLGGDLGFMTAFTGKADALAKPATVQIDGSDFGLVIADAVSLPRTYPDVNELTLGWRRATL